MTMLKPRTHCLGCGKEYEMHEKDVANERSQCSQCGVVVTGSHFFEVFVKPESDEAIQEHVKESMEFSNNPKTFSKDEDDNL